MKKIITLLSAAVFLVSCKSQQVVAEAKAKEKKPASEIAAGHYANQREFTTMYLKADVSYEDDARSQKLSADIRIKKDEKILVSLRFLGVTVAKALITPTQVKYYEKPNNTFFEGDYAMLSKWLGSDLDYNKVQRLLLGEAMDDLNKGKYISSLENNLYKLESTAGDARKEFLFEASKFLLKQQGVSQPALNRSLQVSYTGHTEHPAMLLPAALLIEAFDKSKKTTIEIEYSGATFNEELSFPYSVPDGYERQELD